MKKILKIIALILFLCIPQIYAEKKVKIYKAVAFKNMANCEYEKEFKPCTLIFEYDIGRHIFKTYLQEKTIIMKNFYHVRSFKGDGYMYSEYCGDLPDGKKQFISFSKSNESGSRYIEMYEDECTGLVLKLE